MLEARVDLWIAAYEADTLSTELLRPVHCNCIVVSHKVVAERKLPLYDQDLSNCTIKGVSKIFNPNLTTWYHFIYNLTIFI